MYTINVFQDTVTRYAHQTGHHVERRFGWDCHGLPIEFEIDKEDLPHTKDSVRIVGTAKECEHSVPFILMDLLSFSVK